MDKYSAACPIPKTPEDTEVMAFFQPVLAMDTRQIMGYEVLGRRQTDSGYESLGPFFTDARVSLEEQLRIDRLVREQALAALAGCADQTRLFINLKPSWMYRSYQETGELLTLQLLNKYKIDPSRIIVEVTEEAFRGSMESLRAVIDVYRQHGCQIAIDDIGTGFSSADRIAQLGPSLLKVDIHMMKQSASHRGYFGVLRSFSTLAEQIGASLLIEGVETRADLQRAIEIGARYVQGYLFSQAEPAFRAADAYLPLVEQELEAHRVRRIDEERQWRALADEQSAVLAETGRKLEDAILPEQVDSGIASILHLLHERCIRVYVCEENGRQLSSNHVRLYPSEGGHDLSPSESAGDSAARCPAQPGGWEMQTEYRESNWSWRPYFVSNLLSMEDCSGSRISRTYTDLETQQRIRTLSIRAPRNRVLFLDLVDPLDWV